MLPAKHLRSFLNQGARTDEVCGRGSAVEHGSRPVAQRLADEFEIDPHRTRFTDLRARQTFAELAVRLLQPVVEHRETARREIRFGRFDDIEDRQRVDRAA